MKAPKHIARVKQLPCVACQTMPCEAHHIRQGGISGGSQKASDWFTIPLCPRCHRELHAGIKTWEMRYKAQIYHVANTLQRLYETDDFCSAGKLQRRGPAPR